MSKKLNGYWLDITIKGGWSTTIKIKARSFYHARRVAHQVLFKYVEMEITEDFKTVPSKKS